MNSPQPPPRRGPPVAGGRGTLVGGLPWEDTAASDAGGMAGMPAIEPGGIGPRGVPLAAPGDARADDGLFGRLDDLVRHSLPFSLSVAVHVLVLLGLTLVIVRSRRDDPVVLDVSFLSTEVIEAPDSGVQIMPEPESVPQPQPEEVMSDQPPVDDPAASLPTIAERTDEPGSEVAELVVPAVGSSLDGREAGRRPALVDAFGGSTATEAAVAKALDWLAKQQSKDDGLWSLQGPYVDGGSQENRLAATAMALLAFQGAGNTSFEGKHKKVVERAWKALVKTQLGDGRFDVSPSPPTHHALYSHAQATIAACELYGMTKAGPHAVPAKKALAYALAAQGPNGGWRYEPGQEGDMSVTGWYMMALKSGQMAGLDVPDSALAGIASFLDTVAVDNGSRYGYRLELHGRPPTQVTAAISAEGLLARQYLGWRRDDPRLVAGIELLIGPKPFDWETDKDVYAWYYITQVTHHLGGDAWRRWNDRMVEVLPTAQVTKGSQAGSWDPSLDRWGHIGGRLFTTCFCALMLEVYYRHLPIYGDRAIPADR